MKEYKKKKIQETDEIKFKNAEVVTKDGTSRSRKDTRKKLS